MVSRRLEPVWVVRIEVAFTSCTFLRFFSKSSDDDTIRVEVVRFFPKSLQTNGVVPLGCNV
jgi:hypothetical protein